MAHKVGSTAHANAETKAMTKASAAPIFVRTPLAAHLFDHEEKMDGQTVVPIWTNVSWCF